MKKSEILLQGFINTDYKTLVKLFGKPTNGDGYKVDAQWTIEFEDGTIATIYNYKDGKNYNGKEDTPKTKIRDWHIGGHLPQAAAYIQNIVSNSGA